MSNARGRVNETGVGVGVDGAGVSSKLQTGKLGGSLRLTGMSKTGKPSVSSSGNEDVQASCGVSWVGTGAGMVRRAASLLSAKSDKAAGRLQATDLCMTGWMSMSSVSGDT